MGLGHLCQPCAHNGTSLNGIEGIRWQTTHHGEGMVCHEDIGMTWFIVMKSTIIITINGRCWQPTYGRALFNPYLSGEACFHHDANVKETLNHMLQKNINNSTTYAPTLKDFVESWRFFFNTPLVNNLNWLSSEWWHLIGVGEHTFAPIIHCISTQVCSTSLCEWNWNSYSFVHSKEWKQLKVELVKNLVYIYTNSKLF
jgi:hypothetical protein